MAGFGAGAFSHARPTAIGLLPWQLAPFVASRFRSPLGSTRSARAGVCGLARRAGARCAATRRRNAAHGSGQRRARRGRAARQRHRGEPCAASGSGVARGASTAPHALTDRTRSARVVPFARRSVARFACCFRAARAAGHAFSRQASHSAHEFRRASTRLTAPLRGNRRRFCWPSTASSEVDWIRVHMSIENDDSVSATRDPVSPGSGKPDPLPSPPMLWLLVPVALLALLAFLSRG